MSNLLQPGNLVKLKSSGQQVTIKAVYGTMVKVYERTFEWLVPQDDIVSPETVIELANKPRSVDPSHHERLFNPVQLEIPDDISDDDLIFGMEDEDDFENDIPEIDVRYITESPDSNEIEDDEDEPEYEPENCDVCENEAIESGFEYEANFYPRDGHWYCSNCNRMC